MQFPSPLFPFFKRYLTVRGFWFILFLILPIKYNLTVQSAGPSSRDILGETHLLWHGKSGQVILDISFLRNRHKLPWALCCCLYLHCTSSCRPWRTVLPLCQPRGSSAPGGLVAFRVTQWEHRSSDVSLWIYELRARRLNSISKHMTWPHKRTSHP